MTIDRLLKTALASSAFALTGCVAKDYTTSEKFDHATREARVARQQIATYQFQNYPEGVTLAERELRSADSTICALRDAYVAFIATERSVDSSRVAAVVDSVRALNAKALGDSVATPCTYVLAPNDSVVQK